MIYTDLHLNGAWSGEVGEAMLDGYVLLKIRKGGSTVVVQAKREGLERLRSLVEAALMELSLAEREAERAAEPAA